MSDMVGATECRDRDEGLTVLAASLEVADGPSAAEEAFRSGLDLDTSSDGRLEACDDWVGERVTSMLSLLRAGAGKVSARVISMLGLPGSGVGWVVARANSTLNLLGSSDGRG